MKRVPILRVLVIDDSAFSRQTITRMLERSPLVEVVGVARDGEEALRKTLEMKPDLVTLDLEMPRMDGFTYLRLVMSKAPTPVMVISSRDAEGDVFKALELGAVDFIAKPNARATVELEKIEAELIRKVHAMRELRIEKVSERIQSAPPVVVHASPSVPGASPPVAVIGSSTGGPAALMQIFGAFTDVPECAFLVAQHMPAGFTRGFAERLNRLTPFTVREAAHGDVPEAGTVLIAPGGTHIEVTSRREGCVLRVDPNAGGERYIPSVDRLFSSAAKAYGEDLLAIVLTGMGDDGAKGACQVKQAGGRVIAESEETAVIYGMPRQVVSRGAADEILPLHEIPASVQRCLSGTRAQVVASRSRK
ncbi:MAG: chemotaxis response regulator protein-glutamate methylesterase [Myxococcota bacterium]